MKLIIECFNQSQAYRRQLIVSGFGFIQLGACTLIKHISDEKTHFIVFFRVPTFIINKVI